MSRTSVAIPALGLICAALLAGCATTRGVLDTPDGFAEYHDRPLYTIISPEAVTVRVRSVANDPSQSLAFWGETLERQLSQSGYTLYEQGTFSSALGDGLRFEWVAPVGDEDWIYLTAIATTADEIVIVEGAGRYDEYLKHRQEIIGSLASLRVSRR